MTAEIVPFTPGPDESMILDPFDQFIAAYPRKQSIGTARGRWIWALDKTGNDPTPIIEGAKRAAAYHAKEGTELRFIALPHKWLDAEGWLDSYAAPKAAVWPSNEATKARDAAWHRERAAKGSRYSIDWLKKEGLE